MKELLSRANLIKHGFLNPIVEEALARMPRKKQAAAKATKASLTEKAKGKRPMKESMSARDATLLFASERVEPMARIHRDNMLHTCIHHISFNCIAPVLLCCCYVVT